MSLRGLQEIAAPVQMDALFLEAVDTCCKLAILIQVDVKRIFLPRFPHAALWLAAF